MGYWKENVNNVVCGNNSQQILYLKFFLNLPVQMARLSSPILDNISNIFRKYLSTYIIKPTGYVRFV